MNKSETSLRAYKPHPNYVNPNITNTVGRQFRVYIKRPLTWKGKKGSTDISNNVINASAPTNSRPPLIPGSASKIPVSLWRRNKATFAPNPIRHWRKQLQPTQGATRSRAGVAQVMDRPGGSIITQKIPAHNNSCDGSFCSTFLPTYIPHNYVKPLNPDNCHDLPTIQPYGGLHKEKMVICDPEYRARKASRYASTNLSKKYYTTGKAYLRARVKLHDQNQTLSQKPGTIYSLNPTNPIAANNYVTPTDLSNGSQEYNSAYCYEDCCGNTGTCQKHCVIYKPSNYLFSRNGAVSSSSRIARLKYNTIKNNNWQLDINLKPPPLVGSTPQLYRGNVDAPYFVKSKYQLPNSCAAGSSTNRKHSIPGLYPGSRMPSGGSGIKTVCFPIPQPRSSTSISYSGTVTVGNGSGRVGFFTTPALGSISPSTVSGKTITRAGYIPSTVTYYFIIDTSEVIFPGNPEDWRITVTADGLSATLPPTSLEFNSFLAQQDFIIGNPSSGAFISIISGVYSTYTISITHV